MRSLESPVFCHSVLERLTSSFVCLFFVYFVIRFAVWPAVVRPRQRRPGLGGERQGSLFHLWGRCGQQVSQPPRPGSHLPSPSGTAVCCFLKRMLNINKENSTLLSLLYLCWNIFIFACAQIYISSSQYNLEKRIMYLFIMTAANLMNLSATFF